MRLAEVITLGVLGYTLAQGLQFVAPSLLPATTVTLLLSFTPVIVIAIGICLLGETPNRKQAAGVVMALAGAVVFFSEGIGLHSLSSIQGVLITLISGAAWASYLVLVRRRLGTLRSSLRITAWPMAAGAPMKLSMAAALGDLVTPPPKSWVIVAWLAVVNSALAFFLWNTALRYIRAFELSLMQNTMLAQIALLAWVFLREEITALKWVGIGLVIVGVTLVQVTGLEVKLGPLTLRL